MAVIAVTCKYSNQDELSFIKDGYIQALEQAGGLPVVLPPSLSPAASVKALDKMDGLLLSGGDDLSPLIFAQQPHPRLGEVDALRDEQEFALVKAALKLGLPIMGICRGLQVINAALGGTILQHINEDDVKAIQHRQNAPGWHRHHHVRIHPETMLAEALGHGDVGVNSFHHQAVDKVPPGLTISAVSPDGLVEALECREPWILAVQWHPERMFARHPEFLRLFELFCNQCNE
jgi:putative glutamine amidotransferase